MEKDKQVAVVALNGFLGDRRGRLDVGEIVNARAILTGVPFYKTRRGGPAHGGWNLIAKRRLRKWLRNMAKYGYSFVFVGKSYGAHWILDFYDEMESELTASHALLFDPAHTLGRGENRERAVMGWGRITVVRQTGYRSGYRVGGATDIVIPATHTNIERQRESQVLLDKFLHLHLPEPY